MATGDLAKESTDILDIINERQQIAYTDLSDLMFSRGMGEPALKRGLADLEGKKIIISRSSGGIMMYYLLQQQDTLRKVLIVEDDKNINKLMALSIGKGFEVSQIYDGGEAITSVRKNKPDLVILDLMLPHKDGLDICQTIKTDTAINNTIVILVSAMDPTSNRFKGIKYGADYYVKKPFDPSELRSLVTVFLKKKGKRFDPLIDLPDEERMSKELERSIKQGKEYSIGTIRIKNFDDYARRFGEKSAMVILRLISQLLQDIIRGKEQSMYVGFLTSSVFVIGGNSPDVEESVDKVKKEFSAVMPFILQDEGYKPINMELGIEELYEKESIPKLELMYEQSEKTKLKERRDKILKSKGVQPKGDIGSYTYEELQNMLGSGEDDLTIKITRDLNGVRLQVSRDEGEGD
ncbi:MAG TPA: response regulator transcription factor [Candidatus Acidoferrales bacterium]|nr:response regulator transcription factor [Candidatus Acidoferrales bacterium]